jgi:hypothetical protein
MTLVWVWQRPAVSIRLGTQSLRHGERCLVSMTSSIRFHIRAEWHQANVVVPVGLHSIKTTKGLSLDRKTSEKNALYNETVPGSGPLSLSPSHQEIEHFLK